MYYTILYQHNDAHHNVTQRNDIQRKYKWNATLSIMALNAESCYAEGRSCWVSFMVSVANKPIMLSVIMQIVVMLSVVAPV